MYLEIRTSTPSYAKSEEAKKINWKYMHFINLDKEKIKQEIEDFCRHIFVYEDFIIISVRYVKEPLGAW